MPCARNCGSSRFTPRVMSFGSACLSGFLPGNTNRDPFDSAVSAFSSSIAQPGSGTACSRLFLLCDAGIFHLRLSKSNSVHSALASSPRRCVVTLHRE